MLQHYLIIAIRNFFKYKLQTVISITGLAIGLVCFAYGINWLKYETSYDGFYPQSKQIYMLYGVEQQHRQENGSTLSICKSTGPIYESKK